MAEFILIIINYHGNKNERFHGNGPITHDHIMAILKLQMLIFQMIYNIALCMMGALSRLRPPHYHSPKFMVLILQPLIHLLLFHLITS